MAAKQVTVNVAGGVMVARVEGGELTEEGWRQMVNEVSEAAGGAAGSPVVLDLSGVVSMPSVSLGALMTLRKKLQEGGHRLVLAGAQSAVRNTMAVCRLDKFFEFCDGVEEAQRLCAGGEG